MPLLWRGCCQRVRAGERQPAWAAQPKLRTRVPRASSLHQRRCRSRPMSLAAVSSFVQGTEARRLASTGVSCSTSLAFAPLPKKSQRQACCHIGTAGNARARRCCSHLDSSLAACSVFGRRTLSPGVAAPRRWPCRAGLAASAAVVRSVSRTECGHTRLSVPSLTPPLAQGSARSSSPMGTRRPPPAIPSSLRSRTSRRSLTRWAALPCVLNSSLQACSQAAAARHTARSACDDTDMRLTHRSART